MSHAEEIRSIFSRWQQGLCPGGQVFVARKGEVIFGECFGYADIERSVAVHQDSVFHVASVSKQITCMCALLLHERGQLNVDDDIRKYIPDLVSFAEPVTIRDLMNNVSGVRDQWELQVYSGVRMNDIITQRDLLTTNSRQQSLNFPPRSKYLYSNANFTYVAEIVQRVSKMTFNEFATKNIFEPLGMSHTFIRERYDDVVCNRALSYVDCGDGRFLWKSLNFSNYGATSLHTTAPDFLKWLKNYRNPVICKPETLEIMLTVPQLTTDEKTSYACGVRIGPSGGYDFAERRIISHSGSDAGYRAHVMTFPDDELDIVIFSNTENIPLEGAVLKIAALLLDAKKIEDQKKNDLQLEENPGDTEKLAGRYIVGEMGTIFTVSKDGATFIFTNGDKKEVFCHDKGNCYTSASSGSKLYFREDGVYIAFGGMAGHRLEPCKAAVFGAEDNASLCGIYYNDEVEEFYEILNSEDKLMIRHKRFGKGEILEIGEGLYLGTLDRSIRFNIVKNDGGKVTGLAFTGGRVTEIVFRKVSIVEAAY